MRYFKHRIYLGKNTSWIGYNDKGQRLYETTFKDKSMIAHRFPNDSTDFNSTAAADGYMTYDNVNGITVYDSATTGKIGHNFPIGLPALSLDSYLSFDTSGLADDCTVSAAVLYLYVNSVTKTKLYTPTGTFGSCQVKTGVNIIGAALDSSDWNNFSTIDGSTDAWITTGQKSYTIVTAGNISKTGDTDFALFPNWGTEEGYQAEISVRMTEYTGSTIPKLTVTWSAAGAAGARLLALTGVGT
jgi:hypothetical protein